MNWDMTLDDLDKFIGLVIARGILGQRDLPVESLWDTTWGCSMFNKTLSRCRFKEIMRFLRFDVKSERRQRVILDKFCLVSSLWKPFIENSQKAYVPSPYVTIDEQLLPCKARCRFIQYMSNKLDKFGIKFWMAVDAETKYFYNSFPYLGKDESRDTSVNLPAYVVTKLMQPIFKAIISLVTIFSQVLMLLSVWQNKNVVLLAQSDRITENYHKLQKERNNCTKLLCLHLFKQLLLL